MSTDPEASEKSRKLFTRIEGAAERMGRLVQNLLLLARSDAGALEPSRESLSTRELLDAAAQEAIELRARCRQVDVVNDERMTIADDLVAGRDRAAMPLGFLNERGLLDQVTAEEIKLAAASNVIVGKEFRIFRTAMQRVLEHDYIGFLRAQEGEKLLTISLTDVVRDDRQRPSVPGRPLVPAKSHVAKRNEGDVEMAPLSCS